MATQKQVRYRCAALGAGVLIDQSFGQCEVIAPRGRWWVASGTGSFCINHGYRGAMPAVYGEILDVLNEGLCYAPDSYEEGS